MPIITAERHARLRGVNFGGWLVAERWLVGPPTVPGVFDPSSSWAQDAEPDAIIIATEVGMLHRLQKECPDKQFIPAPTEKCACNECHFMKMNTLEKLHDCMAKRTPEVTLSPEIIERARLPIERMLEISAR